MKAIGVDIGGTFIKYALVDDKGTIISSNKISTDLNNYNKTLTLLSKSILSMIKENKCKVVGVGIGMPGILEDGKLIGTSNFKKWLNINVADIIYKKTKLKTFISNDANVACLAEAKFGSAKGEKNVIMLTLGTGIGGGIIINHKLYEGNKGQGAELGHISVEHKGLKCGCGRIGCFEMYASATALIRQTKEEMKKNKKSLMWKLVNNNINKVDGTIPFIAEKKGDTSAKHVINNYIYYLSEGILNYCNIFRPNIIVLGGGVSKQKKNLTGRVNKYLKEHNYGIKGTTQVKVVSTKLGYNAGIIGAASLVFNK